MFEEFNFADYQVTATVSYRSVTLRSLACSLIELRKVSTYLTVYFLTVVFLHVACRTATNRLNDDLIDVLAVIVGQRICPRYFRRCSNKVLLNKATSLMKAIVNRSKPCRTVQLIQIELSKAYLYRALSREDSDSDSIYCLANVYLAVLCYTAGQYQTAIDHCTLVMRSQDH